MHHALSVFPAPVREDYEEGVQCADCDTHLPEEAYYDGIDEFFCKKCMDLRIEECHQEAVEFALENCRITSPLPEYESELELRCSPDAYAMGDWACYTPDYHMARCRHNCTNYDELIKDLDREAVPDRIYYNAIRERITDLLLELDAGCGSVAG